MYPCKQLSTTTDKNTNIPLEDVCASTLTGNQNKNTESPSIRAPLYSNRHSTTNGYEHDTLAAPTVGTHRYERTLSIALLHEFCRTRRLRRLRHTPTPTSRSTHNTNTQKEAGINPQGGYNTATTSQGPSAHCYHHHHLMKKLSCPAG